MYSGSRNPGEDLPRSTILGVTSEVKSERKTSNITEERNYVCQETGALETKKGGLRSWKRIRNNPHDVNKLRFLQRRNTSFSRKV